MKKKVCILLALVMTFSMTGCSQKVQEKVTEKFKGVGNTIVDKAMEEAKKDNQEADVQSTADAAASTDQDQSNAAGTESSDTGSASANAQNGAADGIIKKVVPLGPSDEAKDSSDNSTEVTAENNISADSIPEYALIGDTQNKYSDDGKYTDLYHGRYESIVITKDYADKFPLLNKALIDEYNDTKKTFQSSYDSLTEEAKNMYEESDFSQAYTDTQELRVQRADDKVLSYYKYLFTYMGGAHGDYTIDTRNFDVSTGKVLNIRDVLNTDNDTLRGILKTKIQESDTRFEDPDYSYVDLDDALLGFDMNLDTYTKDSTGDNYIFPYNWYLTNQGIHFYFSVYTLGSYADGATDVCIGYNENPEIFNSNYLPSAGKGFIQDIGMPYNLKLDIDGDGQLETLNMEYKYYDGDYEYATGVTLTIDNESVSQDVDYLYVEDGIKVYYVKTDDNRNYIYLQTYGLDDHNEWVVFDVSSGKPVEVGETYFSYCGEQRTELQAYAQALVTNPDNMRFGEYSDMLGTFSASTSWHVGTDGMPECNDERRKITSISDEFSITTKEEISGDIITYNGEITSPGTVIPAGTKLRPVFTDLKTYVDVELEDGRYMRLNYSSSTYPAEIGGKKIDDLFDELVYAG